MWLEGLHQFPKVSTCPASCTPSPIADPSAKAHPCVGAPPALPRIHQAVCSRTVWPLSRLLLPLHDSPQMHIIVSEPDQCTYTIELYLPALCGHPGLAPEPPPGGWTPDDGTGGPQVTGMDTQALPIANRSRWVAAQRCGAAPGGRAPGDGSSRLLVS